MNTLEEIIAKRDYHATEVEYWDRFLEDFKAVDGTPVAEPKKRGKQKGASKLARTARKLYRDGMSKEAIAVELERSYVSINRYLKGVSLPTPTVSALPVDLDITLGAAHNFDEPLAMLDAVRIVPRSQAGDEAAAQSQGWLAKWGKNKGAEDNG